MLTKLDAQLGTLNQEIQNLRQDNNLLKQEINSLRTEHLNFRQEVMSLPALSGHLETRPDALSGQLESRPDAGPIRQDRPESTGSRSHRRPAPYARSVEPKPSHSSLDDHDTA